MPRQNIFPVIILFIILVAGCRKESSAPQCEKLRAGMAANDVAAAGTAITQFINRLSSKTYTEQNLNNLAASISRQCGLSGNVNCFDCIKTLPAQSEITISFNSSGTLLQKTFDISHSADGKMKFVNMHD